MSRLMRVRYTLAGWLIDVVWDGKSDLYKTKPRVYRLVSWLCGPLGIPDNW